MEWQPEGRYLLKQIASFKYEYCVKIEEKMFMKLKNRPSIIYYILSFLIPAGLIMTAMAGLKVTPFGNNTLLISDGNGLYVNYLGYVNRVLKGQENILFSLEKGLGGNMMGSWGWFLLNPFFVLFAFADISNYVQVYTYVSVLNFCLCGLTMYILLSDIYGHKTSNLLFSTSYALNGFLVANVFQMNFFTGVATLPLMVLGLKRILEDRSPVIYILSLSYSLLTNFYFGFMLCVASFLIFAVFFIADRETFTNKKTIALKYVISSLLAGLLSSVVWLPAVLSLRGGRLDQSIAYAITMRENMPFLDMFSKLFTGANTTSELSNGLPNIFVGILPVVLTVLFFLNKKISTRQKVITAILLITYLLSFYVSVFNIAMHGGTVTNWFNYRDSFVFSFLLLMAAAKEWQYITEEPKENLKKAAIILVVVVLVVFSRQFEYVTGTAVLIDFAILAVMFAAYWMHRTDPVKNPKRIFESVILVLVCLNLFINYEFCTKNIMEWEKTESEYQDVVVPVSVLVDAVHNTDDSFYRMEIGEQRSGTLGNDPMLYGYYGVGHGGSDDRDFVRNALSKLGVHRYNMRNYYGKGITAATDTLLGLKYLISKEDLTEVKRYEKLAGIGEWALYRNADALPVSFVANRKINEVETELSDVFENLNNTWSAMTGIEEDLFVEENNISFLSYNTIDPVEMSSADAKLITASRDASLKKEEIENSAKTAAENTDNSSSASKTKSADEPTEGTLKERPEQMNYIMFTWTASRDGAVYTYNRSGMTENDGSLLPSLNYEGYHHKGDTITGYLPVTGGFATKYLLEEVAGRFRAAYADADVLSKMSKTILSRPSEIEKIKDSHLRGSFTAEPGQELMFTIPYDEGWTLTIDGKKTEIKQVLGVFMAADVEPGEHTYEMRFVPTGLKTGILLLIVCILLLQLYLLLDKRRRNKRPVESVQMDTGKEETVENLLTEELSKL